LSKPQTSQRIAGHYANTKLNVLFTLPKQCPDPNPLSSSAETSLMSRDHQKQSLIGRLTHLHTQIQHWFSRIFQRETILQLIDKPTQGWMRLAQQ